MRAGVVLPALALVLSGCCFSGREGERFAGSAEIIPIPGVPGALLAEAGVTGEDGVPVEGSVAAEGSVPAEGSVAGEGVAPSDTEKAVAVAEPGGPEVAPGLPQADWLNAFRKLDTSIYFDYDLAALKATGVRILRNWVRALKRYPQADVTVKGHTDSRGTRGYNLWLGERRAKSVQDFLVIRGVGDERVRIISYGEEAPAVSGTNEKAHALNRRAVLSVEASGNR